MPRTGGDEVNPPNVQASTSTSHPINTGAAGATPSAVAGAALGTSPPAVVITPGSTDTRGQVTFGSGTTPATGLAVTVTFAVPYANVPGAVEITEITTAGAALNPAVTSVTKTGFVVSVGTAPAGSQANTVYGFDYDVIT